MKEKNLLQKPKQLIIEAIDRLEKEKGATVL